MKPSGRLAVESGNIATDVIIHDETVYNASPSQLDPGLAAGNNAATTAPSSTRTRNGNRAPSLRADESASQDLTIVHDLPNGDWLRMLLEDLLVVDAATIYPRFDRGGKLYALDVIDGATIKPLIGEDGRAPEPPDPAWRQAPRGASRGFFRRRAS